MTDNDESSTTVNLAALGLLSPFVFSTASFTAPNRVTGFDGHEEVSHPFRFDVDIVIAESDAATLADTLGDTAVLEIQLPTGGSRKVAGVIASIDDGPCLEQGRQAFRVRLVPMLWLLGLRKTSRIFQDKTVVEIVTAVLDDASVPHHEALVATYRKRVYAVQYQETDLAFVTRLLAEEGIAYFFEHASSGETVVLADNAHAYAPIAGDPALVFRPVRAGMIPEERHVGPFARVRAMASGKVLHRDYDFRKPRLDLRAAADAKAARQNALQVYDHEVSDELPAVDAGTAGLRLEQERRHAEVLRGGSACRRLLPGFTFSLAEHVALDGPYVIASVEHRGHAPRVNAKLEQLYENTFRCVAADKVLRPARPVREIRQVTETAVVVGPDGQDIYTDEHGRVKVQFPWDLDGKNNETSSSWIRVAQAWAGTGFGFQFIPRVGMEVVVTFLGGDTDRPIITGCVPNGLNMPPFSLPAKQNTSGIRTRTVKGGGFNELSFDDTPGREQVHLRAQKRLDEVIVGDHSIEVGGSERSQVTGGRQEFLGGSSQAVVAGDREETIAGDSKAQIGGDQNRTVGGDDRAAVRGDVSLEAGGTNTVIAGNQHVFVGRGAKDGHSLLYVNGDYNVGVSGELNLKAKKKLTLTVGDSSIEITPDGITLKGKTVTIEGASGASMKVAGHSLKMDKKLTLASDAIELFASKSSLVMDDDVHLDGKTVNLNCKPKAPDREAEQASQPETGIVTFVLAKKSDKTPMTGVIAMIGTPSGEVIEKPVDRDGTVSIPGKKGEHYMIVGIRSGKHVFGHEQG
jgi:type VI secretion system secreted protein VgrG